MGVVSEMDFYSYCARKIRDLMKTFPCERIAMDAQGGGIAVMEALHDKDKIQEGEQAIWPIIEEDKEKDEGNKFGMALKAAKDKGDDTFVVSGKKYDVKTEEEIPSKGAKKTETGKTAAKVEINPEIEDRK